jgi:hypothetical protein
MFFRCAKILFFCSAHVCGVDIRQPLGQEAFLRMLFDGRMRMGHDGRLEFVLPDTHDDDDNDDNDDDDDDDSDEE